MTSDRVIRRLTALQDTGSTARVLNLLTIRRRFRDHPDLARDPVFENRLLNQSIILKHRVRPGEAGLFAAPRFNATKVLIPIDPSDLRVGARSLFIGQLDFEAVAGALFGQGFVSGGRDRTVLELIDQLPSLDPFLLREQLRQHGFEPARAYFAVSEGDIQRMYEFVRQEISALVEMSDDGGQVSTDRFVRKLLSTTPDNSFAPLKDVLGMGEREYEDGIFAWRGFLYYKWVMSDVLRPIGEVAREIVAIQPRGFRDPDAAAYLREAKPRIVRALNAVATSVRETLGVYDRAYRGLTEGGRPAGFREFLLAAPDMFKALGVGLGAVQHIASFWRYRFPAGCPMIAPAAELMDLFLDFEEGLSTGKDRRDVVGADAPARLASARLGPAVQALAPPPLPRLMV